MNEGTFITFEGIDGAGKSSHIAGLAESFRAQGWEVVTTREPGGTPLAEKLRALVLNDEMDPLTEALLMFAARRDHIEQIIKPALSRGALVICDRFTDSTFAYQGGGRGFDWQVLEMLEVMVQTKPQGRGLLQPDLTLWFDLPPEVAAKRLVGAREPDKFESQQVEFFEKVSKAYFRRMTKRIAAGVSRCVRIDADQPPAQVWDQVLNAVSRGRAEVPALIETQPSFERAGPMA
jgi:dTMP kinase